MPTISIFYGLVIKMYFNDHAPPHFHVQYAEFKATREHSNLDNFHRQVATAGANVGA